MKKLICPAIVALAAFLFWGLVLPYHLSYQEEIQYFPFDAEHLAAYLHWPGGAAAYISEFLVQFFIVPVVGPLIMALLMALLQMETWGCIKALKKDISCVWIPFSAVPSVCATGFMCQSGSLLSAVIALMIVAGIWLAVNVLTSSWCKTWTSVILLPILYYLAGPMVYAFALLAIADSIQTNREDKLWFLKPVLILAITALTLLLSVLIFRQYPIGTLLRGVGYCFMAGQYTSVFWTLVVCLPAVAIAGSLLPRKTASWHGIVWTSIISAVVALGAWLYVKPRVAMDLESVYAYDNNAMKGNWGKIIEMADKKSPKTPAEVTCLNLALVMSGQSGDRLLNYFQAGVEGLFPNYDTYTFLKMTGAEALYRAGLLNMAMHYSFEAYQTFPGFRESGRQLKRLAEVNMIVGNRPVAERYLKHLAPTLFYGKWAKSHLAAPDLWKSDPEYSRLAEYRNTDPDIFDDMYDFPKQEILRSQVSKAHKADYSYNYLLAYDLLSRDLDSFEADFQLADLGGNVPVLYQQALMVRWMTSGAPGEFSSPYVSQDVVEKGKIFLQDVAQRSPMEFLKKKYGNTFWFYYANQGK